MIEMFRSSPTAETVVLVRPTPGTIRVVVPYSYLGLVSSF